MDAVPAADATVAAVTRGIEGVIGEIRQETVIIQCRIADQNIEISLPPPIIPAELLAYGQPVLLSLDYSSGYQRPVVQLREIEPRERLPEEAAVDAWFAAL